MHPLSHPERSLVRTKEMTCMSQMDYLFLPMQNRSMVLLRGTALA